MHNGPSHRVLHDSNTSKCPSAIVHMILIWLHQSQHSSINREYIALTLHRINSINPFFLIVFGNSSETFALYRISYMWYTTFGALTTLIVAGLGTFITGASDATLVDLKLLAPCMRKYFQHDDHVRKLPKKSNPNKNAIPEVDEDGVDAEKESAL